MGSKFVFPLNELLGLHHMFPFPAPYLVVYLDLTPDTLLLVIVAVS